MLRIVRALRLSLCRCYLPRPAPPGAPAPHLPPMGLGLYLGSGPCLGWSSKRRGLRKGRGAKGRRQAMPVPTWDPWQKSGAGLPTAARVGQHLTRDSWASPSCQGTAEVELGGCQRSPKVKARAKLTCSPARARSGARSCAEALLPC